MPLESPFLWNENHLKSLLQLPRHSASLLNEAALQAWLDKRGGMLAVQAYLRQCSGLTERETKLLNLILSHPNQTAEYYAGRLFIGRNTYFRCFSTLVPKLVRCLNTWDVASDGVAALPLPMPITSFVDTNGSLAAVVQLLATRQARLLTLTGPGGVGKTRLALQAASALRHAFECVAFLPLTAISDPRQVLSQIVYTLKMGQITGRSLDEVVVTHLQSVPTLLIFDNFEHLMPAASLLSDLLHKVPQLSALVTSRQRLNLYGEYEYVVPLLGQPSAFMTYTPEELSQFPSVRLFIERAQAVRFDFALTPENCADIAKICAFLDGLPLAIELAASQAKIRSPRQILQQLIGHLPSLKSEMRDLPTRHRSLRNTIEWSFRQLEPAEATVFQYVAVFADSFPLEAAQAVCQQEALEDTLQNLVEKSLLHLAPAGQANSIETRYSMLRILREYALEKLRESPEYLAVHQRYAQYYEQKILQMEAAYYQVGLHPVEQQCDILQWFEQEHANIQAGMDWALRVGENRLAERIFGSLWRLWQILGYLNESRYWMERILAHSTPSGDEAYLKFVWAAGWIYRLTEGGDLEQARRWFEHGLSLAEQSRQRLFVLRMYQGLGDVANRNRQFEQAVDFFRRALAEAEELSDAEETAWALVGLGRVFRHLRQVEAAQACLTRALNIFDDISHHSGAFTAMGHMSRVLLTQNKHEEARKYLLQAYLRSCSLVGKDASISAQFLDGLIYTSVQIGDVASACQFLQKQLRLSQTMRVAGTAYALECCGRLAAQRGQPDLAVRFYAASVAFYHRPASKFLHGSIFWEAQIQSQVLRDAALDELRNVLTSAQYEQAWQHGYTLPSQAITAEAIAWLKNQEDA